MSRIYNVRRIVRGSATGEAIVFDSFSFLGDVDMDSGEIIADGNPNKGKNIRDKILICGTTKGSSGGCVVLMTLAKKGKAPAAIVTMKPADYNLTEGAIVSGIPFVCEPDGDAVSEILTGRMVRVDADAGRLEVLD